MRMTEPDNTETIPDTPISEIVTSKKGNNHTTNIPSKAADSSSSQGILWSSSDSKSTGNGTPFEASSGHHSFMFSSGVLGQSDYRPIKRMKAMRENLNPTVNQREAHTNAEEFSEQPINIPPPIPFRDTKAVIAVDVSRSTRGRVLEQEIKATQIICSTLSEGAFPETKLIPWDRQVHPLLSPQDAHRLRIDRGGTKPSALTSTFTSLNALSNCSAWLLFTDGEIAEQEIQGFSRGIRRNGLHGTACIIVIFGRKYRKPVDCNISVGISVFGLIPNCLFLFHDVETEKVYILQSKGIFNRLLPDIGHILLLNGETQWWDLPTIKYSDLAEIDIPAPRKLDPGDILLQSNLIVRLQDVYDDRVDPLVASELLEVEDNLKTLLLTSEIGGQNAIVKNWITKQKMKGEDILHAPRPNVNNPASNIISQFLSSNDPKEKEELQTKLRNTHKKNWTAFISDTEAKKKKVSRREKIVHSALDRATSNFVESGQGLWTAKMMSPIYMKEPKTEDPAELTPKDDDTDLLFIPGYRYNRESGAPAFEGECPLCGDVKAILALLIKEPNTAVPSPELPEPNSRAKVDFPLAIGSFPEAKLLSSYICCEACAYHLVKLQKTPFDERFRAAIPLIPEAFNGEYKQTALKTLDGVLSQRFEQSTIDQIFLSILYNTLLNVEGDFGELEKKALRWAASQLSTSIYVPSLESTIPLRLALSNLLDEISQPSPSIFQYPLPEFIILVHCIIDINLNPNITLLQNAIFHRILYRVTEKFHDSLVNRGKEPTSQEIRHLIWTPSQSGIDDDDIIYAILSTPIISVSISSLVNTSLLPIQDWEILQKIGPIFNEVKAKYSFATAIFLHILIREQWMGSSIPMEIFETIREREGFKGVLERPEIVGEEEARRLIEGICFGSGGTGAGLWRGGEKKILIC